MRAATLFTLLLSLPLAAADVVQSIVDHNAEAFSPETNAAGGTAKDSRSTTPTSKPQRMAPKTASVSKGQTTPLAASNLQPASFSQISPVPQLQTLFSSKGRLQQLKEARNIAAAAQNHYYTMVEDLASEHRVTTSDVLITIKFDSLDTDHSGVLEGEENTVCPAEADLNNDGKLDFAEHGQYCGKRMLKGDHDAVASFTQREQINQKLEHKYQPWKARMQDLATYDAGLAADRPEVEVKEDDTDPVARLNKAADDGSFFPFFSCCGWR
ncbi:unnamed protein product [Amoebophrya sp. A120]|nr:unnamed protein product [Amoebophrya sp. A120]|eukprot:GSA120T00006861001.1